MTIILIVLAVLVPYIAIMYFAVKHGGKPFWVLTALFGVGSIAYVLLSDNLVQTNAAYFTGQLLGSLFGAPVYALILLGIWYLLELIVSKVWRLFLWIIREIAHTIKSA